MTWYPALMVIVAAHVSVAYAQDKPFLTKEKSAAAPQVVANAKKKAGVPALQSVTRGFDANGLPFIDVVEQDGTKRRITRGGEVIITPNGQRLTKSLANAPAPTPPVLPTMSVENRDWFVFYNDALLTLISSSVNDDEAAVRSYRDREWQTTSDDVVKQISYRVDTLRFLLRK